MATSGLESACASTTPFDRVKIIEAGSITPIAFRNRDNVETSDIEIRSARLAQRSNTECDTCTGRTCPNQDSRLPPERQAREPPECVTGTRSYLASEQTGRLNLVNEALDNKASRISGASSFYG
jgi:hypothetical protein